MPHRKSKSELRAERIGMFDTAQMGRRTWVAWIQQNKRDNTLYGWGPTRSAAIRDLLRQADRLADLVVGSR